MYATDPAKLQPLTEFTPGNDTALAALEEKHARALDRAYYNGARAAQGIAHQSLEALDMWIHDGCGGRGPVIRPPNGSEGR